MEEQLRADRAAMEAMEKECLMPMRERDQMLAEKNTLEKLVAYFLEADANKNFDAQKAMENEIVALISRDGGDGSNTGGSGGSVDEGENMGYLKNTRNQDERAGMATIVGKIITKSDSYQKRRRLLMDSFTISLTRKIKYLV